MMKHSRYLAWSLVFAGLVGQGGEELLAAERDISAMRACDIVRPDEAAAIIGGDLLNDPPAGYPSCAYVVERPDGSTESYRLTFVPASVEAPSLDFLKKEGESEKVPGLWDEACLGPREFGEGYSLVVLKRGDLAFEVSGERKEPLLAIARLVVERVESSGENP